jgi:formylmethanofuran dehydrogenase subunit C
MSNIYWINLAGGEFDIGSNWSGGVVPGVQDEAFLDSSDGNYTVTDSSSVTIGALNVGSGVTLQVEGAGTKFECFSGPEGNLTQLDGVVNVEQDSIIQLSGYVHNGGLIELNGGRLSPYNLTLSGGGSIVFGSTLSQIRDNYRFYKFSNIDDTITNGSGNGLISMRAEFVNGVSGKIIQTTGHKLKIAMGKQLLNNYGLVESQGKGGLTILGKVANNGIIDSVGGSVVIEGAVSNEGTIKSNGGSVTIVGAVDGSGGVEVMGGIVTIDGVLGEDVTFGASGTLTLGYATRFRAAVTGFSTSTAFDLEDIGFVGADEAKFKGSITGGRLTVTDGLHTARISLTGDYHKATFTTGSDGHGGVIVTETAAGVQRFVATAASLAPVLGVSVHEARGLDANASLPLARPLIRLV